MTSEPTRAGRPWGRRIVRRLAVLAVGLGVLFGGPSPASAHPFGPPQTMSITPAKDGSGATVVWRPGAIDDYSYMAVGLGLVATDRTMKPGALFYVQDDVNTLSTSPTFTRYVSSHISMSSGDRACAGTIGSTRSLIANGLSVTFRCPAKVTAAVFDVSMLTDIHPAYRTLASGPYGQKFVYTLDNRTHRWSFDPGTDANALGRSAVLQIGLVLVLIALAIAGVLVRRRRCASKAVTA